MSNVILNSGGMDSFFVSTRLPTDTLSVFIDIGQWYHSKELHSANAIAEYCGHQFLHAQGAHIAVYEHKTSGIIPLRNAEMILCAAQHGDDIHMGILENEVNSDKSPEFLRAMETVMAISLRAQYWSKGRAPRIFTPLGTSSKAELVRDWWNNAANRDQESPAWVALMRTVSCYSGHSGHCGRCPSCFKRWVALNHATDMDFGHSFNQHPMHWRSLGYWEEQGYADKRMSEIREAYDVAHHESV